MFFVPLINEQKQADYSNKKETVMFSFLKTHALQPSSVCIHTV